ncbi:MAG: DUF3341 domain-containing protein [Gemmatimonadetes bacterium]|nr:DUF3341 domain-containing protein [Gemmatimonadota bacterium]
MSATRQGVLASYDFVDSTVEAITALRKEGFEEITAFTPCPEHEIEHALGYGSSPIRLFTLIGGLTGTATGFAFTIFSATDWPLVTGGKPIVSIPAYVVIAFEMTILFGVFATVIGVLWNMRVPVLKPNVVYDPELSAGRFGVYVTAPPERLAAARRILESSHPSRLEEDPEGRSHG